MYKLLIADDEPLEREGLELMIHRNLPNQFHIFHAENGRMAIQQMEKHQPDIIFMDINMPGIQGLEAIEEIKKQNANVKVVILTAYDYFSYAKEAIELGVLDYILKPAKKEQIVDVLQKCMSGIEEEIKTRVTELEMKEKLGHLYSISESECALMLMTGAVNETSVTELLQILNVPEGLCVSLVIEFAKLEREKQSYMFQFVKQFMKSKGTCLCSPLIDNRMTIFYFPANEEISMKKLISLSTRWLKEIEKHTKQPLKIGIGSLQYEMKGWKQSYDEAVMAIEYQPYFGRVKHVFEINTNNARNECMKDEVNNERLYGFDLALRYIGEHYHEDLTLEQVAQIMNFHPHYFSRRFKKETGQTFSDYLTHLRIEKAKELIKHKHLNIKEISYHVGYKDPNYFSRVFKKVTNRTPKEYRNQLKQHH
jgi:two-component system, response regulator YesN